MARTAEDILSRRTRSLLLDAKAAIEVAPRVAKILADKLQRDKKWVDEQVSSFNDVAQNYVLRR
jgi:glycerol-3-phosphate dehydrogenase